MSVILKMLFIKHKKSIQISSTYTNENKCLGPPLHDYSKRVKTTNETTKDKISTLIEIIEKKNQNLAQGFLNTNTWLVSRITWHPNAYLFMLQKNKKYKW
ncbi:hypothetical protein RIF29_29879 [Crotalaria pallida]|uniref:Uncharacterized protein n=1 Tax=Crotalaria pallida TaxID=3830 RepID=A0AAN9HUA1_CROPI